MRKVYWYFTAYFKKYGLIFLISIISALILFSFFISSILTKLDQNKHYYLGLIGAYGLNSLPETVQFKLSKGLTKIAPDGSAKPLLAKRWLVEQEGLSYRFVLKDNIVWNDGKPVTTNDIKYHLNRVETIITAHDIVFKLPTPFSPFPTKLAQPIFRPGYLTKFKFFKKPTLIGISPFRITDYIERGHHLLKQITIKGVHETYTYKFYLTENEAVKAFKQGKVDILPDLAKVHDIFHWSTVKLTETIQPNEYLALFFNLDNPLLSKNVRKAFSYAIDKDFGRARALGPISPNSWAYFAGVKHYRKNEARAIEQLLTEIPHQPLNFKLTTTTLFVDQASKIKADLETIGKKAVSVCQKDQKIKNKKLCDNLRIKIKLHISNFPDKQNFQMLLIGQMSPFDPDQYALWHSGEPTNFTNYKNIRIDSLLEKGRQTNDLKERTKIYQEFQQFLLEDPPAVFLRYLTRYRVERK